MGENKGGSKKGARKTLPVPGFSPEHARVKSGLTKRLLSPPYFYLNTHHFFEHTVQVLLFCKSLSQEVRCKEK